MAEPAQSICIWCDRPITKFRNKQAREEYALSGYCQQCQDNIYGTPEFNKKYDDVIEELQVIIDEDDEPPVTYIALPLSNMRGIRSLPFNAEYRIPDFILGSWYWAGPWLKCLRALAREQDIPTVEATEWNKHDCPECMSSRTCRVRLSGYSPYYCPDCGLEWLHYPAWCPSCGGIVWKKDCTEGEVICTLCGEHWAVDIVKSANKSGDILVEL